MTWQTIEPAPLVLIDPEAQAVTIAAHGGITPLVGLQEMRDVRDALTNHIALLEAEQSQQPVSRSGYCADGEHDQCDGTAEPAPCCECGCHAPSETWLWRHPG